MARLTQQSKFMFSFGAMFSLIWGFLDSLPSSLHGDLGWVLEGIVYSGASFGIAYTIKRTKNSRSWNAVAQWFLWLSLILPIISYWAGIGR